MILVAGFSFPRYASAQTSSETPWNVNLVAERAGVTNAGVDGTWTMEGVQVGWAKDDVGGWSGAVERHGRYGQSDTVVYGHGYRRAGDWTIAMGAGATAGATFLYRTTVHGELSRRIAGTLVGSAGYHHVGFRQATIEQVQPALTWYHSRGHVEARHFITVNRTSSRTSHTVLARTQYAASQRLRVGGGAAAGDRIFDIALLPTGSAHSSAVFGHLRVGITARDGVEAVVMRAREEPGFIYRSVTLRYARSF